MQHSCPAGKPLHNAQHHLMQDTNPLFHFSVFLFLFSAPLTNLDIGNNRIGVEGAKAIAAVLPRCVQLQNGMRLAPSYARNLPLFSAFVGFNLVSAPLTKLTFGDHGAVVLDAAVESMDLSKKRIDAVGAMIIAAFLPRW